MTISGLEKLAGELVLQPLLDLFVKTWEWIRTCLGSSWWMLDEPDDGPMYDNWLLGLEMGDIQTDRDAWEFRHKWDCQCGHV